MDVVYKRAESKEEIRNWIVLHGGKPAIINDPAVTEDKIGLRINWPGQKDEGLLSNGRETTKEISWEEFFDIMERLNLDFEYSEEERADPTWIYRFVPRFAVETDQ